VSDHARENALPDLIPQGSIPQVLERVQAQREYWETVHNAQAWATPEYNTAVEMLTAVDELLTALRSLPPVPMQEMLEDTVSEMNHELFIQGNHSGLRALGVDTVMVERWRNRLAAALRSLASPNSETDQKDDPRVDR
jgi:hypothetical protein